MTAEENNGGLSAAEEAYFSSRGETDVPVIEESASEANVATSVATEAAATEQATTQERDEKGKFVPHGALHAEREEHKKTREELRRLSERQAVSEDRWNTLLQASQKQEATPEVREAPDPNVDIFAHAKWQSDQLAALNAKIATQEASQTQARQQAEQEQAIWNNWNQSVQQFAKDTPDFGDAAQHLLDLRVTQLKTLGLSKDAIDKTIDEEVKGVVLQAAQAQKSPAQVIYEYAKASGFSGPKPVDATTAQVSGALPDKLVNIQAAQSASRSVAAAAGGGAPDPESAEALLSMSDKDFAKWLEKGNFKKVMGG